ncbi:hypothetical protein [Georgenia deserti]|uniref:M50 family peptidase n=1 Tax=Georgenia deserti TaxID=2093781 RepID=A0ABW4L1D3_9MICO
MTPDRAEAPTAQPTRPTRAILLPFALVAAAATMVHIQLHEYSHAAVALAQVGEAEVRGAVVFSPDKPDAQEAVEAITGPVFSVVSGVVALALARGLHGGYLRAFLTWFGLVGIQNLWGYLMIAMIAPLGDTAVAFGIWGVPTAVQVALGLVGVAGMLGNSYLLAREITRSLSAPSEVLAASVLTWLLATGILAVVYTAAAFGAGADPEYLVITVVGPATALVFAPMAIFFWTRTPHRRMPWDVGSVRTAAILLALAVALVLVHALAGVRLGG